MKEDYVERIVAIIASIIEEIDLNSINYDIDLKEIGMDSISFIRLIVILEDEFEIEIPDDYLLFENMSTINKIVNNIKLLISENKH